MSVSRYLFFVSVLFFIACGHKIDTGRGINDLKDVRENQEIRFFVDLPFSDERDGQVFEDVKTQDLGSNTNGDVHNADEGVGQNDELFQEVTGGEDIAPAPPDRDHDGVPDKDDECPDDPHGWKDTNHDGKCNDQDDDDHDGITNGEEKVYGTDCAVSNPESADTDGDGINDNEDPFPRDPFPEFILFQNDEGTIDMQLSNRDGTFKPTVKIGALDGCTRDAAHNCPKDPDYRYTSFVISDFDNNGRTDFLATGSVKGQSGPRDLWWFFRTGSLTHGGDPNHFEQRLVDNNLGENILGGVADLNNDNRVDLYMLRLERGSGNFVKNAWIETYINTGLVLTADCAWTTNPINPRQCAFIKKKAIDLTNLAQGKWMLRLSRDAVDLDGDGNRDLVFYTIADGTNTSVPVYLLSGRGDGTFKLPLTPMLRHNNGRCGSSPANSIVFGDFNNDGLGDIILGWDDDGDAGSAWFYPGKRSGNSIGFDTNRCFEAIDLNPSVEDGQDNPGVTYSARAFDFNFDGNLDIILGWDYKFAFKAPSRTILFLGKGNGSFRSPVTVRDFPDSSFGNNFASPQRLCRRFPIK